MGYRSDVTIVMYSRQKDKGRAAFNTAWLTEQNLIGESAVIDDGNVHFVEDHGVVLEFTDVKWYPSYTDVALIMDGYKLFEATFCKEDNADEVLYACEYIRMGEDEIDVEVRRSDYSDYLLTLRRSIACDLI